MSYEIHTIEISNCPSVLLPIILFKNAKKVTLKNIASVTFHNKDVVGWSEGTREFVLENCGLEELNKHIFENGTSGSNSKFSKIAIVKSNISRLDPHTFNNIEIDDFTITDSKINGIGDKAFDMKIQERLNFSGNSVKKMDADSFAALKVDPDITITIQRNHMKELRSKKFNLNFDSSMNNVALSKVKFEENYVNQNCNCDLFEAKDGHFHKREILETNIYGKLILSFECNFEGGNYNWFVFDKLRCGKEHGHGDHDHDDDDHEDDHGNDDHEDKKTQGFFDSKFSSQNYIDVKDDLITGVISHYFLLTEVLINEVICTKLSSKNCFSSYILCKTT